jgi:hypothetical protein
VPIDERDAVAISLEGPAPQRRATVAFRLILAIPILFWAYLLAIPLYFAIIGIWFAALFTARVPESLADFEARVLQFQLRQYAYAFYLMSDRWPSFALGPIDYPVELEVYEPPRMNRAAVFFRYFLLIPAGIVFSLVGAGLFPIMFVLWIVVLVSGRMPDTPYYALAAVLRYQYRFLAYAGMLTSAYPHGLFGDEPESIPLDTASAPSDDLIALPARPRLTRLTLEKGSKRLIVLAIVLGVLATVGSFVGAAIASDGDTASTLDKHHKELEVALQAFTVDAQTCAASGQISCIREANGRLIAAIEDFRSAIATIDFPSDAVGQASVVDKDAATMVALLRQLQETSDPATVQSIASSLQAAGQRFDDDYRELYLSVAFR